MQKRNLILLAVAVAIGLIAVLLANAWFSGMEGRQERTAQSQQTTKIVVASSPLEFGARLTAANTRLQDWPAASVPTGAFTSLGDAMKDNRVALRPMVEGEPVLASNVSGTDGRATLAALLPAGMRAVSVSVNEVRGVSGFVLPGMLVDVILTRKIQGDGATSEDVRSDVILENVRVLAIDQLASDTQAEPKLARTATLAVTLRDAQRLAVADKIGTLSLALRRVQDGVEGASAGGQLVTARDLGGPRLVIPGRATSSAPVAAAYVAAASGGVVPPPLPAMGQGGSIPAASGRVMTIVRGVEATSYPISQTRGR